MAGQKYSCLSEKAVALIRAYANEIKRREITFKLPFYINLKAFNIPDIWSRPTENVDLARMLIETTNALEEMKLAYRMATGYEYSYQNIQIIAQAKGQSEYLELALKNIWSN